MVVTLRRRGFAPPRYGIEWTTALRSPADRGWSLSWNPVEFYDNAVSGSEVRVHEPADTSMASFRRTFDFAAKYIKKRLA